jgi:hypothetical protein
MSARQEYFDDLLKDCTSAIQKANLDPEDEGLVIAALIVSDSFNGLRKVMLQLLNQNRPPRADRAE